MNLEIARSKLTSALPDEVVQALALLGEKGSLTDLQALINLVKSANSRIKKTAIEASTSLILENLLSRYHELETSMRQKLGSIMESMDPLIVDGISKELYSSDDTRRLRAVQILGLLRKNPRIYDILANLVKDKDEKIRATAISLLGKLIGPHDHEILMALLNDKDSRVRANTVEALEGLKNKRLVPVLLRFRKDNNNRVRGNVLKALYTLGFTDVLDDILEMLNSKDNFTRATALWVITRIKLATKAIEDAAGYCLLVDNEMVLNNAKNALNAIGTQRAMGYLKYLID